jgi:hypothetical protein
MGRGLTLHDPLAGRYCRVMRTRRICAAVGSAAAILGLAIVPAALGLTSSQQFTTAGEHPFVVPAGVTSVQVMLVGGNGGAGTGNASGGIAGTVSATLAVTPGETLYAEVAGDGVPETATMSAGGYGGGGDGSDESLGLGANPSGGGGGGASDVRTVRICSAPGCPSSTASLASRLVVAAGGGGGGGQANVDSVAGGPGGPAEIAGNDGQSDGHADLAGTGGKQATASTPGAPGNGGTLGTSGALGVGGAGAPAGGGGGGGGGGGIAGGGGGGGGAVSLNGMIGFFGSGGGGGGGGSSGVPAGASGVSGFSRVPTATGAEPQITLSWTVPSPSIVLGPATGVTDTGATLTGTVNPNNSQITNCHFTLSPAAPVGSTIACAQQLAAGATPVSVSARLSGLRHSTRYTVTLVAASAAGTGSGSAVTFTTPAPRPAISRLAVARRVPRKAAKHKHAKAPVTISLRLSQNASLSFTFERVLSGRRSHRGCSATKTKPPRAKRCVLYSRVRGTLTLAGRSGADMFRFSGVLDHHHRLMLGRYRLTVVATNSGGKSSPRRATFTLVS